MSSDDPVQALRDTLRKLRDHGKALEAENHELETENERLRELVAGPDDGRCWYSRSLLDEVVAERDEWKRRAEEATEIIRIFMDEYVNRYGIDGAYDEPMERGRTLLARHKEADNG